MILRERSLRSVGYPDKIDKLGNSSGSTFGKRCDYVFNQGVKHLSDSDNFSSFSKDDLLGSLGFSSEVDFDSKCGINGEDCLCDPGYSCQETDKLNALIGNVEFQDRAGKKCMFRKTCKGDDVSAYDFCLKKEYRSCYDQSLLPLDEREKSL